jgi:hypothetical protein
MLGKTAVPKKTKYAKDKERKLAKVLERMERKKGKKRRT